ncbi:uncharacterized protein K489DRAFT_383988 [Dissoconium aciculare CBS 342.82]|uniref:Uncharacterized protein n=1 Tax=Dissoconium aciculare CBS 342.82 TaxID=1314786 RepID=A0A6J3LWS6_9PEZI|nr:uncharacterized protein K489DRAFT_383988 [Dissoconium aciculare CBS 342.82]KAF1819092.1 hypothetical protein K489DRAFT_383988 [Dissoconium aciculare CBS 342.82]
MPFLSLVSRPHALLSHNSERDKGFEFHLQHMESLTQGAHMNCPSVPSHNYCTCTPDLSSPCSSDFHNRKGKWFASRSLGIFTSGERSEVLDARQERVRGLEGSTNSDHHTAMAVPLQCCCVSRRVKEKEEKSPRVSVTFSHHRTVCLKEVSGGRGCRCMWSRSLFLQYMCAQIQIQSSAAGL